MKTDKEIKELAIQKLGYDCHEIIYNTFILAYKLGCDETKQNSHKHSVMQAEASASAEGAAVGNSAAGKGVCVGSKHAPYSIKGTDGILRCAECGEPYHARSSAGSL